MVYVLWTGTWTLDIGDDSDVQIIKKKNVPITSENQMYIHINTNMNVHGLRRSIFVLSEKSGKMLHKTCLLQYHLADENQVWEEVDNQQQQELSQALCGMSS